MARAFLAIAILALVPSTSIAQPVEKARLARTMWAAFECATLAEMSGDGQEQARLFEVGLKAGRGFLEAVSKNEIPTVVAVPVGVRLRLQGPSPDFILGRLYEAAADDAFDEIVKMENGTPLEPSKWINDPALRKQKAANRYTQGNCLLLK